ncbi:MAG: lipocalin family protein [Saprospiraceae bacterium]|jgi:hypothetical protein
MKYTKLLLCGVILALGIFSCGKNDDSPLSIVGKWNIVRSVDIETSSSIRDTITTIYKQGSYIDFQKNGTVSLNLIDDSGTTYTDTATYTVVPNGVNILVDNDTEFYEIKKLTSSELTIYLKDDFNNGAGDLQETYIYANK